MSAVRTILVAIGSCLILAGGLLLLWFGYLVYAIVTRPEEFRLIQFVLEQVATDMPVVSGPPGSGFAVYLSDSTQTFGFFILGIFALGVLAGIVKALLWGGVAVVKAVLCDRRVSPLPDDDAPAR